jgi:hypothetical protein
MLGWIEVMTECARKDLPAAMECFAAFAEEIQSQRAAA